MSPISIALNLLLAALLVLTLLYGFRLSRQLKALKDSHAGFADAVGDLDRAASRAESGLNQLRVSTDEAVDLLMGRIDKARELAKQLEVLTARAEAAAEKVPVARPSAQVRSIFDRPRAEARPTPNLRPTSDEEAEAAAEALILRLSESEVLTTAAPPPRERAQASRFDSLFGARGGARAQPRASAARDLDLELEIPLGPRDEIRPAARAEVRPSPRSRAQIDDDLFEPPARGGRLRAFDGGLA
jgi:hypothetical protein